MRRERGPVGEQLVQRRMAALAAPAGTAALRDLLDRGRAVLDLAPDATFVDTEAEAHQSHQFVRYT